MTQNRQIGANPQQLMSLSQTFVREADEVKHLISQINSQLDPATTWWVGPRADAFRQMWSSHFMKAMTDLSTALNDAGKDVAATAQRIEQAGS